MKGTQGSTAVLLLSVYRYGDPVEPRGTQGDPGEHKGVQSNPREYRGIQGNPG